MSAEHSTGPIETWKSVIGFEGWYEVSDAGRIKRVRQSTGSRPGKILRATVAGKGYLSVMLSVRQKHTRRYVHRMVTLAFLGPEPGGCEVNHKDGDKRNCALRNLEYVTRKENVAHALDNGLTPTGEKCSWAKLRADQVLEIRRLYAAGGVSQSQIARQFGITQTTVFAIVNGRSWRRLTSAL